MDRFIDGLKNGVVTVVVLLGSWWGFNAPDFAHERWDALGEMRQCLRIGLLFIVGCAVIEYLWRHLRRGMSIRLKGYNTATRVAHRATH